jgi:hypothetical protein
MTGPRKMRARIPDETPLSRIASNRQKNPHETLTTFDFVKPRISRIVIRGYDEMALGKRVWKSSRPTHSGVTVMRTMFEIKL